MILGEVASWCLYLATKSSHMRGGCGWASLPSTLAYGPQPPAERTGPTCQMPSCLVTAIGGGAFRGTWRFPGIDTLWGVDCLGICIITYGKSFLSGGAYPLAESS
jgi:hypothetical protein